MAEGVEARERRAATVTLLDKSVTIDHFWEYPVFWHHCKLSVVLSEDDWGVVNDEIRVDRNGAKKNKALCRARTISRVL